MSYDQLEPCNQGTSLIRTLSVGPLKASTLQSSALLLLTLSSPHSTSLFIEKLPKHPEYAKAPATDKSRIKKLLKQALPRAMELKEKLKSKYEKEKEELEKVIQEEEVSRDKLPTHYMLG